LRKRSALAALAQPFFFQERPFNARLLGDEGLGETAIELGMHLSLFP